MFRVPERYRLSPQDHQMLGSTIEYGNNGFFIIPDGKRREFACQVSDGLGWEHVSVTLTYNKKPLGKCPSWRDMVAVKAIFWEEDDVVVQYHPPASAYVNCHPHCLHLWRPVNTNWPVPSPWLVGPKEKP